MIESLDENIFTSRPTDKMRALHNPEGADVFTAVGAQSFISKLLPRLSPGFLPDKTVNRACCGVWPIEHEQSKATETFGHSDRSALQLRPSHHL